MCRSRAGRRACRARVETAALTQQAERMSSAEETRSGGSLKCSIADVEGTLLPYHTSNSNCSRNSFLEDSAQNESFQLL